MEVWDNNIIYALGVAIRHEQRREASKGFTMDSAYLVGIKALKEALERGESIVIQRCKDEV